MLLLMSSFAALGCSNSDPVRSPHSGTDVVIVLVDTLRPDHLGFYGYGRETAPFLHELSQRSAVFDRAYSTSSWTAPATASLLTGLYPQNHGVVAGFFVEKGKRRMNYIPQDVEISLSRLPETIDGIASLLQAEGYRTYGIATNTHISPELGFDKGFDRYAYMGRDTIQRVKQQLADWAPEMLNSPKPTFLYLHLNDVHGAYKHHEPWYEPNPDPLQDLISAYDSGISQLDEQLREIGQRLAWSDSTLLIFVSDHGEEFKEHGELHHRGGLHQELTRVLLMIGGPGIESQRIAADVSLVDVLPTALDLLEIDFENQGDGTSLAPILTDESTQGELSNRILFAHRLEKAKRFGTETWAAVQGRWKLIDGIKGRQLFDLDNDFFEQVDLSEQEPEILEKLQSALADYRNKNRSFDKDTKITVSIDPETQRHLEELGYVTEEPPQPQNTRDHELP